MNSTTESLPTPHLLNADYHIEWVPVENVHSAEYEPQSRLDKKAAMPLARSIQKIGLLNPPIGVRQKDGNGVQLGDGHRRLLAVKILGWPKIPIQIRNGTLSEIFSAVCSTTKKVSASDWTEVYVKGGELPSGSTRTYVLKLEKLKGRKFVEELSDNKTSPVIWATSHRALKYMGLNSEDENLLSKCIDWLLKHKISRDVNSWSLMGMTSEEIKQCFKNDVKPSKKF